MKTVSRALCLLFVVFVVTAASAVDFSNAQYFKKNDNGKKSDPVSGVLRISPETKELKFVNKKGDEQFVVKSTQIKSVLYERTSKPRYAAGLLIAWPLLFTKSKSHYLTVQYDPGNGAEAQYAIVKLDKNNYRDVLASIETTLNTKVQRTEEN